MTPARPGRRLAAAAAVALLVGACADQEAPSPEAAPPPGPPSTAVAPLDPAGLEPLVVADAPQGFTLADDEVGATGPTDLAEAAGDTPGGGAGSSAGEALADAGFVRGWQRLWLSDDQAAELFLLVYEFATPDGAEAFFERTAGDVADDEAGTGVFDVPGIPGAVGVGGGADGLAVQAVVFASGPYLVQVIGNGPEPGPSQGTVVALASAQAARLG